MKGKILVFKGILIFGCLYFLGCKQNTSKVDVDPIQETDEKVVVPDSVMTSVERKEVTLKSFDGEKDTSFIRLADYSKDFAYDMRYATENNFLKEKVYECAECYTRVKTAKALIKANRELMDQGYRIKFYDCYRPRSVQYKMWALVPNPQYVADPSKGSIHNRGGAVDITLVTMDGTELDMGTDFDYFGRRAYHDNYELPKEILDNRKLLKETMEKYGFWSVRSEWWHYNLSAASSDKVANFNWPCPN